jgi:hypothetical protein
MYYYRLQNKLGLKKRKKKKSFNVLHKPFIRIYQLFPYWILIYERSLDSEGGCYGLTEALS